MQTIWSRAAQVHGCSCQPRGRAASVLARRSVTATRPNCRKVAPSHVFTACYSAIMATAAVADAAAKDRRRKQLDHKIEEARDNLVVLLEQSPAQYRNTTQASNDHLHTLHNADDSPLGIYEALTSICVKPIFLKRRASRQGLRKDYLERLRERRHLTSDREWWKTPRTRMEEVLEMVAEEERMGQTTYREPVNAVQFAKWSEMINDLVDQLLVETYRAPNGTAGTPDILESAWNNIRMLRSSRYPNYRHPDLDPVAAAEARHELNVVTRNIFRDWHDLKSKFLEYSGRNGQIVHPGHAAKYRKRREYFVGKICHNLLIAKFPPGIYNYNTLIAGFAWVGEPRFGQAVVDSFLLQSRLKPTQMTVTALLHHYTTGDIVGLYNIIRRITGEDSRGLLIRRKPVKDVKTHRKLFQWARYADAVVGSGFVTERSRVDEPVLEALLDRLIDFEQTRHAVTVLAACLREGIAISTRYVHRVVGLVVARVDRVAALELLRHFLQNVEGFASMLREGRHTALPKNIHRLVQICESNAQRRVIVQARENSSTPVRNYLEWNSRLDYLRTALWTTFAEQRVDDIASWAKLLTAAVAAGRVYEDRLDYFLRRIGRMAKQHEKVDIDNRKYQVLVSFDWITELCKVSRRKGLFIERQVLDTLWRALPNQHRHGMLFDRKLPLLERLQLRPAEYVLERRLELSSPTAKHFTMARELENKTRHVMYTALPRRERRKLLHNRQLWNAADESKAVSFGLLVRTWSRYLDALSSRVQPEEPVSGLRAGSHTSDNAIEDSLQAGRADSRQGFFSGREPWGRARIPAITAV